MMGGARPQPPQTFKPTGFLAWARAELVRQPLSIGLEVVRAGCPRVEALPLNTGASLGWIMKPRSGQPMEHKDGDGLERVYGDARSAQHWPPVAHIGINLDPV